MSCLENDADVLSAKFIELSIAQVGDIRILNVNATRGRPYHSRKQMQESSLSFSALTQHQQMLARSAGKIGKGEARP